jgi:hypothetical protein
VGETVQEPQVRVALVALVVLQVQVSAVASQALDVSALLVPGPAAVWQV